MLRRRSEATVAAVNPEMLVLARESEGIALRELSNHVGISYSTLSRYESGLLTIREEHLLNIAACLDRPLSYFYRRGKIYAASGLYHRKRSRVPLRELKRIHAHVNELRLQASALLKFAEIESDNQFFRLDLPTLGTPENAAARLRQSWQLPTGPIRSVVDAIEAAGGIVFRCEFRNSAVDGISQWPLDDPDMPPVFFVSEDVPGDRERWTLSHELGHVVLHHLPTADPEAEADRFASEFLMPAEEIGSDLEGMTLERAAELKAYWRVSMAAIIRRARDLEQISARHYRTLCMQMSSLGYRKCEPIPIPPEEPQLFSAVLDVLRTHHRRSDHDLSEMMGLHLPQFTEKYGHGFTGLRLVV